MSNRTYTIPAREVVPGMLVDGHRVTGIERTRDDAPLRIEAGPYFWLRRPDAVVEVTLPGPSPRELLCDCALADPQVRGQHSAPEDHLFTCPVFRLRLRLWPVGARWDEELRCYVMTALTQRFYVNGQSIADDFPGCHPVVREELRAAFCEPLQHGDE